MFLAHNVEHKRQLPLIKLELVENWKYLSKHIYFELRLTSDIPTRIQITFKNNFNELIL